MTGWTVGVGGKLVANDQKRVMTNLTKQNLLPLGRLKPQSWELRVMTNPQCTASKISTPFATTVGTYD